MILGHRNTMLDFGVRSKIAIHTDQMWLAYGATLEGHVDAELWNGYTDKTEML